MRMIQLFSVLFLFASFSAIAQKRNAKNAIVSEEIIFPLQNEHTHGRSIVMLPNGDLLAAWFQGSGERSADDVRIMGARLKKGLKVWTTPFLMADTKGIPDLSLIHISEPTRLGMISYAVFCLKK